MEILPQDIKIKEFYKHLSYESLIQLCNTNKEFNNLCYDDHVWQYLLQRDFAITSNINAKQNYILYKQALDFLSNNYEIITLDGLIAFVDYINKIDWYEFLHYMNTAINSIFSTFELRGLIQNVINDLDEEDEENHPFIIDGDIFELIRLISKNVPKIYIDEIRKKGCSQFLKYSQNNSFIFKNKKLIVIPYDLDVVYELQFQLLMYHIECQQQINKIIQFVHHF